MLVRGLGSARVPIRPFCRPAAFAGRVTVPPGVGPLRDSLGNTIHFVYVLSTSWSLNFQRPLYELEFDFKDVGVPPGTLYLTGGDPAFSYDVDVWTLPYTTAIEKPGPLSVVSTGVLYPTPISHAWLTAGKTATFDVDGFAVSLVGGQSSPIPAGASITVAAGITFTTQP